MTDDEYRALLRNRFKAAITPPREDSDSPPPADTQQPPADDDVNFPL